MRSFYKETYFKQEEEAQVWEKPMLDMAHLIIAQ